MNTYEIITLFLVFAALMSYLNERFLKLPGHIGHFLLGLSFALVLFLIEVVSPFELRAAVRDFFSDQQFSDILINGMLGVLLFVGGLNTPIQRLEKNKSNAIGITLVATFLTTFLVALFIWGLAKLLPIEIPFIYALIFGALISPTDSLTTLSVLTKIGLPKRIETLFIGESLFNSGIGYVLFTVFASLAVTQQAFSLVNALELFLQEVGGGFVMGLLLFGLMHYLVKSSQDLKTRTLVTLGTVSGGYALCLLLSASGPIAMAIVGILAGSYTFKNEISRSDWQDTKVFWELINEILNSVLFILIGLQFIRLSFTLDTFSALFAAILVLLAARFISVLAAVNVISFEKAFSHRQIGIVSLFTWGGLRGGLPIAMAFSLQDGATKALLLDMTFAVVAFSILVQGLTMKHLFSKDYMSTLSKNLAEAEKKT